MAVSQSDLDTLDRAITEGVLEVRFQDRVERFNTTDDLLKARTLVDSLLHPPGSSPVRRRQIRMITGNGW